ncbi:MAG: flagellar biosynthesis protein FlhB [Bacillota bacterium]
MQFFAEEKTEEATPHRRQEARKKGQVSKSTDLNAALILGGVLLCFLWGNQYFTGSVLGVFLSLLGGVNNTDFTVPGAIALFRQCAVLFFKLALPVFVVGAGIGLIASLAQVGIIFAPDAVRPKMDKINPLEGFRRIFSRRSLFELVKSLLKVVVVGIIPYYLLKKSFPWLLQFMFLEIPQIYSVVAQFFLKVALSTVGVFLLLAVIDYIWQRRQFLQQLRMSKQEVKEEYKQMEGDPQVRGRLREKQRTMARQRMMQQVPQATVVITNPTHLAVALRYEPGETAAPLLVAKGAGWLAKKIIELARTNKIPVVENKELARFIYTQVETGFEIPLEIYQAVAETLAMLYRLGKIKRRTT